MLCTEIDTYAFNHTEDTDTIDEGFSPKSYPSSITTVTHSHSISLEEKLQALEQQLEHRIQKEIALESQLVVLQQQLAENQKRNPLNRISKQINHFLSHKQRHEQPEIPDTRQHVQNILFDKDNREANILVHLFYPCQETHLTETNQDSPVPIMTVFLHRLRSMIQEFNKINTEHPVLMELGIDLNCLIEAWQTHYSQSMADHQQRHLKDQETITRLLRALHRSLLKNRVLERDTQLLMKQSKVHTRQCLRACRLDSSLKKKKRDSQISEQGVESLELHVTQLASMLAHCQEEKEEYETTLELMRREMEGMLEELEDTRQQRTRYKQQATRLRDSIQKKIKLTDDDNDDDEEEDRLSPEDLDEERDAIRLLYREAERQTNDLDRECKRQSLALTSLRNELKSTEQKYQSLKLEKNKRLIQLEQLNQHLTQQIHQLERQGNLERERAKTQVAEKALDACMTESTLLRTRIYQLEQQEAVTKRLSQDINRLEFVFSLSETEPSKQTASCLEIADRIETEQKQWKQENRKLLKRQHDIDTLRMHRESRELATQMSELEDELERLKRMHQEELRLLQHQAKAHLEKGLQQAHLEQTMKEQELKNQLDVLFHKNQTLHEESLALYGRNILLTNQLGKISS